MPQTSTALENLGINILELAETAKRLGGYTTAGLNHILTNADKKLKLKLRDISDIVENLCYDELFLSFAGIPYDNPNSTLIKAAIADYLILKQTSRQTYPS